MTPEERQACFDQKGYWPTTFVPRKVSPKAKATSVAVMSPEEIRRFPRLPRRIETHAELHELIEQGQGFVFNNRDDRKMLHQAKCEALQAMVPSAYEKLFFEDLETAQDWLDRIYGAHGWVVCGRCR